MMFFRLAYAQAAMLLLLLVDTTMTSAATVHTVHATREYDEMQDQDALMKIRAPDRSSQTAKYRANYVARFQWLLESTCGGPNPVINVLCQGTFELIDTSDSSIVCEPLAASEVPISGFSGYQCRNTCSDRAECSDVWLTSSRFSNTYGQIFFQCEGEEVVDVDAAMQYLGSEGNTCSSNFLGDGRSFHIAQLGVFCEDEYNYRNSNFFECDINDFGLTGYGGYTCAEGDNCKGSPCTRDFTTVTIEADHFRLGECIQSLDNSELPEPEMPELITRPPGEYVAQFRSEWRIDLDFSCEGEFPTILVECPNGEISNVDPFSISTNCELTSPSTLSCAETDRDAFVGTYSGVDFTCTANDALPTFRTTYPSYPTSCEIETIDENDQKLRMAIFCGNPLAGGFYWYNDYPFNCNAQFYSFDDNKFTCFTRSNPDNNLIIDETVLSTDFRWSNIQDESCWSGPPPAPIAPSPVANPPEPTAPAPVANPPTAPSPVMNPPSPPAPTESPVAAPTQDEDKPLCFSASATVQVDGKGTTRMDELSIGDLALTSTGSYSKIYSFSHFAPQSQATFLQIQTSHAEDPLEVTADHLLFGCADANENKASLLRAGEVKVGSSLLGKGGGPCERVVSVDTVTKRGVYSPVSETGDIVVNGIATSNYVSFAPFSKAGFSLEAQVWMQHTVLAPYRHYCRCTGGCESEKYSQDSGFSPLVAWTVPLASALDWILSVDVASAVAAALGMCYCTRKWHGQRMVASAIRV